MYSIHLLLYIVYMYCSYKIERLPAAWVIFFDYSLEEALIHGMYSQIFVKWMTIRKEWLWGMRLEFRMSGSNLRNYILVHFFNGVGMLEQLGIHSFATVSLLRSFVVTWIDLGSIQQISLKNIYLKTSIWMSFKHYKTWQDSTYLPI